MSTTTEITHKYTVTWTRPYQGEGNSTAASDGYDSLAAAWAKADLVEMELGSGARPKVFSNGHRINRAGRAK